MKPAPQPPKATDWNFIEELASSFGEVRAALAKLRQADDLAGVEKSTVETIVAEDVETTCHGYIDGPPCCQELDT